MWLLRLSNVAHAHDQEWKAGSLVDSGKPTVGNGERAHHFLVEFQLRPWSERDNEKGGGGIGNQVGNGGMT